MKEEPEMEEHSHQPEGRENVAGALTVPFANSKIKEGEDQQQQKPLPKPARQKTQFLESY